jgi:predicted GNAT family acetyltransferase
MRVLRFDDARAFAERAEPYLMAHEAVHCLPLGLTASLAHGLDPDAQPPYLALAEDAGRVVSVALRTPPFNLVLSLPAPGTPEDDVARVLAEDARQAQPDLSGVIGSSAMARAFAEAWHALSAQPYRLEIREGIYELTEVRPPSGVPGSFRLAAHKDRPLLMDWLTAFNAEALPGAPESDVGVWVDRALASPSRTVALWEAGGVPVSLACAGSPTPHGIRVGPVYTPPERRGHGYASACVAELSQRQLASGRRFCFLYTNLANPTANHIYQTIGYRQVGEAEVYRFG